MTTTRDSNTLRADNQLLTRNPLASFVPKVGHGRPPITMSRWKMIKEIVSDGIYILKNRRKYSDLEVAKAKRLQAERRLAMLKEKFEREGMQLEREKKKAIEELNHVKQIKEDLMHRNQKILDSFDNELDGSKK